MIGIDIKMPKCCGDCDLENSGRFCVVTGDNTFSYRDKWRMYNCPLRPLEDCGIQAGNEIEFVDGVGKLIKGIILTSVATVEDIKWCMLTETGDLVVLSEGGFHHTGRHFDEIEILLKKLRGECDG